MMPFPLPITALYWPLGRHNDEPPEGVAILALSAEEYLAIDADGRTIAAPHDQFEIVGAIKGVVFEADVYLGS